jgi:hypothetical protein
MENGFKRFLEEYEGRIQNSFSQNTTGVHNDFATAKFLPSTGTGSEDLGLHSYGVPGVDLEIPSVVRKSKIRSVEKSKDPIKVSLMDGTVLYMTLDEFNRVDARTKLVPGRDIRVTFQRREDDGSPDTSKVVSID